jgi:hypothetical protein
MHKSVLRPSEASEEQVVEASVSPFDVVLQEGDDWTCPECIPLTGVPVDEPYQDEGGCSRCGVSRNPWDLICAHQASFHTIAQCIVDNYGISQLNSTLPPAQAPQASVGDSVGVRRTVSNAVDLQRVEVPLALRRDRVMQSVVAKLQEGGWSIREAIQRMLEGERREWELVTCTPDPRSAVLTRHLLRLVSDPRRLDRARQVQKCTNPVFVLRVCIPSGPELWSSGRLDDRALLRVSPCFSVVFVHKYAANSRTRR